MESVMAVIVTAPDMDTAGRLARALVEERLAACATIFPARSVYRWKGAVEDQDEVVLLVKTGEGLLAELTDRVRELHPYEVPEVIALPVAGGNPDYLGWVADSTRG